MGLFNNRQDDDPDQNLMTRSGLMCLVAAYIIYLGVQILKGYIEGEEGLPAWAALLFGILFIVLGGGYLVYLLRTVLLLSRKKRMEESQAETLETPESAESQAPPETPESPETPHS